MNTTNNLEYFKNSFGEKAIEFYKLEQEGFNIPPFIYLSEDYIYKGLYKFLDKDDYFINNLKNDKIAIRTSIVEKNDYTKHSFYSYLNLNYDNLKKALKKFKEIFLNYKRKKNNNDFKPGVIIQKMIKGNIYSIINITKKNTLISYNKSFDSIYKDINTQNFVISNNKKLNKMNKKYCNYQLIKLIDKLKSIYKDFNNINLQLIYSNYKWYIISFNKN